MVLGSQYFLWAAYCSFPLSIAQGSTGSNGQQCSSLVLTKACPVREREGWFEGGRAKKDKRGNTANSKYN